jgi:hypothetical protein
MFLKAPGLAELLTSISYNLCCPDALQQASMNTPLSCFFFGRGGGPGADFSRWKDTRFRHKHFIVSSCLNTVGLLQDFHFLWHSVIYSVKFKLLPGPMKVFPKNMWLTHPIPFLPSVQPIYTGSKITFITLSCYWKLCAFCCNTGSVIGLHFNFHCENQWSSLIFHIQPFS